MAHPVVFLVLLSLPFFVAQAKGGNDPIPTWRPLPPRESLWFLRGVVAPSRASSLLFPQRKTSGVDFECSRQDFDVEFGGFFGHDFAVEVQR